MDKLDEVLKLKADNEKEFISDSLENKINNILISLPRKKSRKPIIAAGLAATLISAPLLSVYGSDIPIVKEVIGYFNKNDNSYYVGEKNIYEKYTQKVGITKEDKGVKVTVDGVYCDDNNISVFYTVEGGKDNKLNEKRNLHSSMDIDFDGYKFEAGIFLEENVDESGKIQGVFRRTVTQSNIPKNFDLKVNFNIAYEVEGNWEFQFNVKKQEDITKYTKEYTPNIEAKINNGVVHDINIEKVVLSPTRNHIVISEKDSESQVPLLSFVVYDDKDNLLGTLHDEGISGLRNSYKFPSIKDETKALKFVPIIPQMHKNAARYFYNIVNIKDDFPKKLQAPNGGNIIINKIVQTDESTEVYFQKENLYRNSFFQILNENDESVVEKWKKPILVDSDKRIYKQVLPKSKDRYKLLIELGNEVELGDIPKEIEVSDKGSIKITKIERTEKDTKVYYKDNGVVLFHYISLINPNGDSVGCDDYPKLMDEENGIYMISLPKSEENYRLYVGEDEKYQLDFNQAITIPLK